MAGKSAARLGVADRDARIAAARVCALRVTDGQSVVRGEFADAEVPGAGVRGDDDRGFFRATGRRPCGTGRVWPRLRVAWPASRGGSDRAGVARVPPIPSGRNGTDSCG